MTGARLVVADDSVLLREGLVGLLERQGFEVVAQEGRADALVQCVRELAAGGALPDAVITDVRMPPGMSNDGLRAALDPKTEFPALGMLVVSQYVAPLYAQALVGSVSMTAQWWLDVREPKKEVVAAHLVNLCWNGLTHLESDPVLHQE